MLYRHSKYCSADHDHQLPGQHYQKESFEEPFPVQRKHSRQPCTTMCFINFAIGDCTACATGLRARQRLIMQNQDSLTQGNNHAPSSDRQVMKCNEKAVVACMFNTMQCRKPAANSRSHVQTPVTVPADLQPINSAMSSCTLKQLYCCSTQHHVTTTSAAATTIRQQHTAATL